MATILCHMACEIAVERALSAAFAARGISELEQPIEKLQTVHMPSRRKR
jgi:hypothetical protein